jgi:hypothetical protein
VLQVAVNKQQKEDLIEDSLAKIKHNFPRLKGIRNIYPTPKMQELVAQVYQDVLSFAQMAIEYYKRPAIGEYHFPCQCKNHSSIWLTLVYS